MTTLDKILEYVQLAASIAGAIPGPIAAGSKLAGYFLAIAQAAVKAHEGLTGQPLDLAKLHDIDPIP